MTVVPYLLLNLAEGLVAWLRLGLDIFALVVCIRYVRLSASMPLLVLAFAGFAAAECGVLLFGWTVRLAVFPDDLTGGVRLVAAGVNAASAAALAFGLLFVLRDLRERLHFVRDTREPQPTLMAAPSAESKLEPTAARTSPSERRV